MRRTLAAAAAALIAVAAATGGASPARAAGDMETGIADDAVLLGGGPVGAAAVERWKALGIDVARIHARWIAIAPAPHARTQPEGFDASNPDDPQYNWGPLDGAVALLRDAGIRPMLSITGSGPLWASQKPSAGNPRYRPSPARFGEFATAVARRYGADVDRYIIWNEPNQPGWLQPQFTCSRPGRCAPASPHLYRDLFRAGARAVRENDPRASVLIGALAPRGGAGVRPNAKMRPLEFIRALGCVDARYRRIRTGACRRALPVVASGFAYHPHAVLRSPRQAAPNRDDAAIADLHRVEQALDRTQAAGILRPATTPHLDLYLTEFGYQTRPPDPFSGVSPSTQSAWLQESDYIAWHDPRVRNMTQYEWRDEELRPDTAGITKYAGWQSGLLYADGRAKPALSSFPHPFFIDVRRGQTLARFWGQVRPGTSWRITIARRTPSGWSAVKHLSTNRFGYWTTLLPVRTRSTWSFTYEAPGPPEHLVRSASRTVSPRT